MFDRLKQKWKVGPGRLALILLTFAIGGSLTGYVAKKIMNLLAVQQDWLWAIIYILMITVLWPVAVILRVCLRAPDRGAGTAAPPAVRSR